MTVVQKKTANQLKLRSINQLLDKHFFIPYYQRGYRWTEQQVVQLLDDIWDYTKKNKEADKKERTFYCLQPVVVKPKEWKGAEGHLYDGYEVIDGQQRLTTLFIIIKYLMNKHLNKDSLQDYYSKELFTIEYETRPGSHTFLNNIKEDNSNVDYYYIYQAYEAINKWFKENAKLDFNDINDFLGALLGKEKDISSLQVIWYEVQRLADENEDGKDSKKLFNRLNLGKINLTNAELIKALFLASDKFREDGKAEANRKKIIIAQLWDRMEKELNDEKFWSFITNKKQKDYPTKIELLFDFISGKKSNERDYYFTFLHFLKLSNNPKELWKVWQNIELYFNTLKEWQRNRDKHHKIGFLIACGINTKELLEKAVTETKEVYDKSINEKICEIVDFEIQELDYTKGRDKKNIEKLLVLFNVETTRTAKNDPTFYPFQLHKAEYWSIEHIQAQNSENFDPNKKKPWIDWIAIHLELLKDQRSDDNTTVDKIIEQLEKVEEENINWDEFQKIFQEVIKYFSEVGDKDTERLHTISNLALLTDSSNSALNNAVFLAKRNKIIDLDKKGHYIPICTKRLFLRYYGEVSKLDQVRFWTALDRKYYFISMLEMLFPYLNDKNKSLLEKLKNNPKDE